jgi:hypothetical protein
MAISLSSLGQYALPQANINSDITPQLAALTETINKGQKQQTLADIGKGLANGSLTYQQAAGKLASTGDLTGFIPLLQLGEAQKKQQLEQTASNNFLSSLGLGSQPQATAQPSSAPISQGPVVPNDSNAIPGTVGMNQALADKSQDFIQDNPGTYLSSGVRSTADQARLYADRGNNPNPVAAPGTSRHERGLAVDIGGMSSDQRGLLSQYGLAQPVANDPPHVELAASSAQQPVRIASADNSTLPAGAVQSPTVQPATPALNASDTGIISRLSPQGRAAFAAVVNPNISAGAKEGAKQILSLELDQAKLPDQVKQYVFAKGQGYAGTYVDFRKELAAAGKTEVNVDTQGQNAFAKAGGQAVAKRFEKLSEEGDTGTQDLALVGQLRDLGNTIQTGAPAAIQSTLAKYGIKVGDNVGAVEAYDSIVDKLTPTQRVPGSGATSDYEGRMFKNSLPTLMKTPEGNAIVQNTLAGLAQYKIDRAKIAEAALAGDIEPKEALKQLRALPSPYDNFKKFAKGGFKADPNASDVTAPQATPQQSASPPVQGARQAPDGNWYVQQNGKYFRVDQ